MYSYNPDYAKYLVHHGIEGQEWGVKNGPPYPLNRKTNNSKKKVQNKTNNKETLKESVLATYATWYGAMAVVD